GIYYPVVTVTDDGNATAVADFIPTVDNVSPALSLAGASAVAKGSPYTLNLSASDPGTDTIDHWTIDWDDGTVDTVAGNPPSAQRTRRGGAITYSYSAVAAAEDGTVAASDAFSPPVANVAPALALTGAAEVDEGRLYTLALVASDLGTNTIDHWTIDWDDGT